MLYPIRVDATSQSKSVRIIDTILIDLTCLPISPSLPVPGSQTDDAFISSDDNLNHHNNSHNYLTSTITQNAQYLANSLLSDSEVQNSGKVGKAGRVFLLNKSSLVQLVEEQIETQLRIAFQKDAERKREATKRKKRRLNLDIEKDVDVVKSSNDEPTSASALSTGAVAVAATVMSSDKVIASQSKDKDKDSGKDTGTSYNLIPIKIRLRERGMCIADEFKIDPDDAVGSNPILLAETMVKDLNLPDPMCNSIAISIAEQMCGQVVPHDVEGWTMTMAPKPPKMDPNNPVLPSNLNKRIPVNHLVPTAWEMEPKEESAAMVHMMNIGKPVS